MPPFSLVIYPLTQPKVANQKQQQQQQKNNLSSAILGNDIIAFYRNLAGSSIQFPLYVFNFIELS